MKFKLFICLGYVIFLSCAFCDDVTFSNCGNVHGRNFSRLSGSWKAHHMKNGTSEMYNINICNGSAPSACEGKAVCKILSGNSFSYGDSDKPPLIKSASSSSVNFYLEYNTSTLCSSSGENRYYYRSSITFECGRTLGSPVVISSDDCSVDFLWETSVACLPHESDAKDEVRCYAYDSKGFKRDLEVLIKLSGGHSVVDPTAKASGQDGVYINVCRDIQAHTLPGCPEGAAACLVKDGHQYVIGNLDSGLTIDSNDRLRLEYVASSHASIPPDCGSFSPRVIITFVCPGSGRGGSKLPIVTSSQNCQYNIEWWTEAACPEDHHTSSTCGLDVSSHGIDLDLSQLTKTTDPFYYLIDTHDTTQTKFYMNVCAPTRIPCGKEHETTHNAVCQTTQSNEHGFIAGEAVGYKVRYFDEQLSLVYLNGGKCSNGVRRMSIILFHCNETAGKGAPTFNHELHCTYYFDWHTSYACLATPRCHVTDDAGLTYDLSSLTRIAGPGVQNWEALNGQAAKPQSADDLPSEKNPRYFINVCGEVLKSGVTSSCAAGSSVCSVDGDKQISYGSFATSSLVRQNNKLILTYRNGDKCSDKRRTTRITFYCRLGDLESSPVVKYESADSCELALTWHTAAACPVKSVTGKNCMVSDEESGLTFDLQSLSKSGNENYKVSTPKYDFLLNVCEKLSGSPCNEGDRPAAACQVELNGGHHHFTLGEKSSELLYYNGFIKLLYTNGDPYRSKFIRSTQISFLCDTKAGTGHPQFVKEGDHTYVFNWYTSLVCPAASTQCMVTDANGNQYDLSSLAKSEDDQDENWTVLGEDVPGHNKRKYYLNVCRPVNDVRSSSNKDVGCDALAGACETSIVASSGEEHISVSSMGRPTSGPQIEGHNRLILTYTGGKPCTEDGVHKNFSTIIHFVCEKGALSSSPRFLERRSCSVSFEWRTEAACPIAQSTGGGNNSLCEVQGANSKYTFNLQPLQRKANNPYVVTGPSGSTYEVNICGRVTQCEDEQHQNLAGCKKTSDQYSKRVASKADPVYSDDGRLTISYEARDRVDGRLPTYEISFICNRTVAKGQPVFTTVVDDVTRFDFQTSLACQPEAVDCLVTDDYGNQYDLSPLSSANQQWSVVGSDKTRRYYLSVCRPLPPVSGCEGLASGACYTKRFENGTVQGHNLGLIQSNPQAVSDGTGGQNSAVTITYMGGDRCPAEEGRRYSTRILFQCSQEEGAAPVLQNDNSDPCEFYFVWQTPAACPVKKTASSSENCTVTDPLYHMTFDLSTLKQSSKDYHIVTGDEWNYDVNICSELKQATGACEGYGSCQVKNSDSTSMNAAGRANSTLMYEDGVVTLTYLHGKACHQHQYERSTTFRFTCHHEEQKPSFIKETGDCTYIVDWSTPLVCPPVKVVECLAQDGSGSQYDLSALSLSGDNHLASTRGDTNGRVYYINVCRSLLHRPGVTCPPNSAACFKTQQNKFYNLGQVTTGPHFVDGKLTMTYTNGDTCLHDTSKKYSTTVTFQCDINAPTSSTPVLTGGGDSCDLEMLWVTRSACPVGSHPTSSTIEPETSPSCAVANPLTRHIFNLSTLASSTYHEINGEDGFVFHLNVCKKVKDTNCADGTGNCVSHGDEHFSAGAASGQLSYKEGALSLHYEHGKTCEADNRHKHSTVVSFVCHRSASPSLNHPSAPAAKPVYISDDAHTCTHYFSWHTHLACEIQKPCAVVNAGAAVSVPHVIDLSPLISESGHYLALSEASGTKAAYYINVCRPLEPIRGVACPPGSAVCEVTAGHVAQTLGYVDPVEDILTYDDQSNTITLQYASSRPCATSSKNVSTRIVFSCVPGANPQSSVPRLTTITSDCVYLFEWGTDILCPTRPPSAIPVTPATEGCTYTDPTGVVFDLTKIETAKVHDSTGAFEVSPCLDSLSGAGPCKDASACFTANSGRVFSLGSSSTRKISSGSESFPVQIAFTNGTECPTSSQQKSIDILFRCIRNQEFASGNKPRMIYSKLDQCHYSLYWPTPYICLPPSESCVATYPATGATYDLSLLSSLTHSWNFEDKEGNAYFINICRPLSSGNSWVRGCKDDATVCRITKKKKKAQSLGVLRSQKMQVTSSTSLTLSYSGGSQDVCEDEGMTASTSITFICDRSVTGAPQFAGLTQSNCVFRVTWKTRIACLDQPETVTLDRDGKFVEPKSGATIDLSPLLHKTWTAKGDVRQDKNGPSLYNYAINLRGNLKTDDLSAKVQEKCKGSSAVCQYKPNKEFARPIAEYQPSTASYVMADESLEITLNSSDLCHKDKSKHSHVVISLRCSEYNGIGTPTFVYESNECGYFFEWYTNLMCAAVSRQTLPQNSASNSNGSVSVDSSVTDAHHSSGSTVVLAVLFTVFAIGILALFLRKTERRIAAKQTLRRVFCSTCTGHGGAQYRYIKSGNVGDENTSLFDDDDVMREETSLLSPSRRTDRENSSNPPSIGGAVVSDDDDIFSLPDVAVTSRTEKKTSKPKSKNGKPKAKPASNPFGEGDDLFPSTNSANSGRVPGVGGEKVVSYHDDDDDDMLDA